MCRFEPAQLSLQTSDQHSEGIAAMYEARLSTPPHLSILEDAMQEHDQLALELIARAGVHLQRSREIGEALEQHARGETQCRN